MSKNFLIAVTRDKGDVGKVKYLFQESEELMRILVASVKTAKSNKQRKK